jgi:hypothetical protein
MRKWDETVLPEPWVGAQIGENPAERAAGELPVVGAHTGETVDLETGPGRSLRGLSGAASGDDRVGGEAE